ncbi:MAG: hypothetical protein JJU00_11360 [Opitutales bacterium]|nr:hypothetical protein [Opitutales bacterium]
MAWSASQQPERGFRKAAKTVVGYSAARERGGGDGYEIGEVFHRLPASCRSLPLDSRPLSDKLKDMKSVTTREIQQNTRSIRQRLESGESLQWAIRGRVVAHLTPARGRSEHIDWGDPLQRLESLYTRSSGEESASAADQIYQDRG